MEWVVLGGVGLVFVGLVIFALIRSTKKDWRWLARRMGMAEKGGAMAVMKEGLALTIEAREASNKRVHGRLVFRIGFPTRLGLGLSIMGRPPGKRSLRILTTGDAAFDDLVAVESREEKQALAYLTPERRDCLKQLIETDPRATVNDAEIVWNRNGTVTRLADLKQLTDELIGAGQTLYPG